MLPPAPARSNEAYDRRRGARIAANIAKLPELLLHKPPK
jgi:hypothetical protein